MARQTMSGRFRLAMFAIVPLAVSGCSYIAGEMKELEPTAKSHADPRLAKRIARAEPNQYHSVPSAVRETRRTSEPLVAGPHAPRPVEPEQRQAPIPAPPAEPYRPPIPAVVPVPPVTLLAIAIVSGGTLLLETTIW